MQQKNHCKAASLKVNIANLEGLLHFQTIRSELKPELI